MSVSDPRFAPGSESGDPGCANLRWALALLDGLLRGGMQDLVLSPGSRSTPLVMAGQRRQPLLTLTPVLDERSAAFFALGLARGARRPVGLLCTSGSAPGHWLPAVIEAAEWGVPLVLLSADRPPEQRAWGASQTVDQLRLFGQFVREFHDPGPPRDTASALKAMRALGVRAAEVSKGRRPGPVHINLPFREPLVPREDCAAEPDSSAAPRVAQRLPCGTAHGDAAEAVEATWRHLPRDGRGLICCGPGVYDAGLAEALSQCAEALSLPVIADPLSSLRFGPGAGRRIAHYDSLLRSQRAAESLRPDWVLRIGRMPVSKTLTQWLSGVPAILLDPSERWCDPTHDAEIQIGIDPRDYLEWLRRSRVIRPDPLWLAHWHRAEDWAARLADEHLARSPWCEGHLIRALLGRIPAGEGLFCSNSLPIRQLDTWSGTREAILVLTGNRGASGIDGQTSTLAGLNAAGRSTWGLFGDLALCHDLSGLFLAARLDRPVIVLNNGGGRIFDYLPQRGLSDFERLWRTPVSVDFGELARPFGLAHRRVDGQADPGSAFAEALDGLGGGALIEVCLDAEQSQQTHETFWRRIAEDPGPS